MHTTELPAEPAETERLAYGVEAAAKAADVGRTTIYKAMKEGRLRSVKKGDRRLILREWLLEWLTEAA